MNMMKNLHKSKSKLPKDFNGNGQLKFLMNLKSWKKDKSKLKLT